MTALTFHSCSLAEKTSLPSPQLTKLVHRNHRENLSSSDTWNFMPSLILLWKHLGKPGPTTAKAHSVLQQEMLCVLFNFGDMQTHSGSVPSTLQVLGAHFINTCWEFRVCRNPGWSELDCVCLGYRQSGLSSSVDQLLQGSDFDIIFKNICHNQWTNLMNINPILYCFTVYFYVCIGHGCSQSARIPKLKTQARAPFPTPATVFPKPQP